MVVLVPIVKYQQNYGLELKEKVIKDPKIPISFFGQQTPEIGGIGGKKNLEIYITNYYNSMAFDMP